ISEGRVVTINRGEHIYVTNQLNYVDGPERSSAVCYATLQVIDAYIVELRSYSCRDKPLEKLLCCDRKTMIYYPEVSTWTASKSHVTINKLKSLEESIVAASPSIASTIASNFPKVVLSWTGYCMDKFRTEAKKPRRADCISPFKHCI
ncbi:hypothetical protein MJO29_000872, partial [Puccinia striiformis f. sp. tritici]